METNSQFAQYLPSKKIKILLALIITALVIYFIAIPLAKKFINRPAGPILSPLVIAPDLQGNPLTRDSDNDTIPDWKEIALGLDPNNPSTVPGVFDRDKVSGWENQYGADIFTQAEQETTDTDKLSFTLGKAVGDILKQNPSNTPALISNVTQQELLNYIDAKKAGYPLLKPTDLTVVEISLENNQAYGAVMKKILQNNPVGNQFPEKAANYLNGEIAYSSLAVEMKVIDQSITTLKTTPVPNAIADVHLAIVNDLITLKQALLDANTSEGDELSRIGILSITQDALLNIVKDIGNLNIYLSVALDPKGYIN